MRVQIASLVLNYRGFHLHENMLRQGTPIVKIFFVGHPRPLFPSIFVFSHSTNTEKMFLVVSWDRTRIVGAVGENADHYTTTTALDFDSFDFRLKSKRSVFFNELK